MKDEDLKLDRLLKEWNCSPPSDPRLEIVVWRRIAEREEPLVARRGSDLIPFGRSWAGPALAASLGLAAIVAGIGAAEMRMQTAAEFPSVQKSQEQAYFESINPVALARHDHR